MTPFNLLSFTNADLASFYMLRNGITGAFALAKGPSSFQVLEGDPATLTGCVVAEFTKAKEAADYADAINERIKLLLSH